MTVGWSSEVMFSFNEIGTCENEKDDDGDGDCCGRVNDYAVIYWIFFFPCIPSIIYIIQYTIQKSNFRFSSLHTNFFQIPQRRERERKDVTSQHIRQMEVLKCR